MKKPRCMACGRVFEQNPRVKAQKYCSAHSCQKERKRRWQKKKRAEDTVYNANQRDAHNRWRQRNPDYWRDYRKRHPDYVLRNKERQRQRNRLRRQKSELVAKMDASGGKNVIIPGHYQLIPLDEELIAKMDPIKVKIDVISRC